MHALSHHLARVVAVVSVLAATLSSASHLYSQNRSSTRAQSIFEALSVDNDNEGTVTISQPAFIKQLVGTVDPSISIKTDTEYAVPLTRGFRILAFSGNLSSSKQEAYRRAQLVMQASPNTMCYITYNAPFWKLMVGDFKTREEAQNVLATLQEQIPELRSEFYIVRSQVRAH